VAGIVDAAEHGDYEAVGAHAYDFVRSAATVVTLGAAGVSALKGRGGGGKGGPKGGTYQLVDKQTGQVMRNGRTGNHDARRASHLAHPVFGKFEYEIRHKVDSYFVQRGLEQMQLDKM